MKYGCITDEGECGPEGTDCQGCGGCPFCDEFWGGEKSTPEKMLAFRADANDPVKNTAFEQAMEEIIKTPEWQELMEAMINRNVCHVS